MNLLKAASTVSLLTLASRITGLAREWLVASQFGASGATDAFNVAFRLPNLLRRLFAEGAFSQAFVPLLGQVKAQEGHEATRELIDAVATTLAWVLLGVCVMGVAGAPVLVWLMASGLSQWDEAVFMTRLMFPYIACMSLVALAAGILNTYRHFSTPAATPVILNLCVIGAAAWGAPQAAAWGWPPIYALCAGVMVGGVLQVAVQWPVLRRLQVAPRGSLRPAAWRAAASHPGVRQVLRQMGPALLGVSVAQLSLLINTLIASHQGEGAISWLTYADRLMEFPTALLGVALGVVLMPQLSAARAEGQDQRYSELLDWGLRWTVVLALPCAVVLWCFGLPLVSVLYHYGAFTPTDVHRTTAALQGYGVGLWGLIAIKILAPGFYARQDIRTPVRIAVGVLLLTQLLNLLTVPPLGVAGLSLSIGLAALVNAAWLARGLVACGAWVPQPGWWALVLRVAVACALLAGGLWWLRGQVDWLGLQAHWGRRAGLLLAMLLASGLAYLATLSALGWRWRSLLRQH